MDHRLEWYDGRRLGTGDLRTVAWHHTPRRTTIPRHRPAGDKLALVVAGSMELIAEPPGRPARRTILVGGRFTILPRSWHLSGSADGRFFWASLTLGRSAMAAGAVRLLADGERAAMRATLPGIAARPLVAGPGLIASATGFADALRAGAPRIRILADAGRLLAELHAALLSPAHPDAGDTALDALIARLAADPAADPGAEALAATAGLSRAVFFRRFRQRTGETPHRHLTRLRCRLVAEAVAAGEAVDTAWGRAGFASRQAWRRGVAATGPDLDRPERR